jgi:lipoprotein-anchoring transpeptidase ErfK/SrfK
VTDDLERSLQAAFDAQARSAVRDSDQPPVPRFASTPASLARHRWPVRILAPLGAAAAVIAVVLGIVAVSQGSRPARHVVAGNPSTGPSATRPAVAPAPSVAARAVHVTGYPDGSTVGVGMPVVATFNKKITDGRQFAVHTSVTVNGNPAHGAWYFEPSDPASGHVMEAHYRLSTYWPAHAHVHVAFRLGGVSAGAGLAYDGRLTSLDFTTGPRNVATVDDSTHKLTLTSDGKRLFSDPVSLGARNTPTAHGVKVIMEKGRSICMSGPGYKECGVKYTQRLTYSGEYLHAAPWNSYNIQHGIDSSNGCTNLTTADARTLYKVLQVGDVVDYPDATGPAMTMGAGYGDWNISWPQWRTGGLLRTS